VEGTQPLMGCDRGPGSCGVGAPFPAAHCRRRGRDGERTGRGTAPFGWYAVIIVCVRAHDRFDVTGPICQRRGAPAALIATASGVLGGVAPLDLINHRGGVGARFLTFAICIRPPNKVRPLPLRASTTSDLSAPSSPPPPSLLPIPVLHDSTDLGAGTFPMALINGDLASAGRVGERRAADAGRRRPIPDVDGPVGVG
jgi:hypothetical protein